MENQDSVILYKYFVQLITDEVNPYSWQADLNDFTDLAPFVTDLTLMRNLVAINSFSLSRFVSMLSEVINHVKTLQAKSSVDPTQPPYNVNDVDPKTLLEISLFLINAGPTYKGDELTKVRIYDFFKANSNLVSQKQGPGPNYGNGDQLPPTPPQSRGPRAPSRGRQPSAGPGIPRAPRKPAVDPLHNLQAQINTLQQDLQRMTVAQAPVCTAYPGMYQPMYGNDNMYGQAMLPQAPQQPTYVQRSNSRTRNSPTQRRSKSRAQPMQQVTQQPMQQPVSPTMCALTAVKRPSASQPTV